jgi:TDG/mug DNA glycosylase family protein
MPLRSKSPTYEERPELKDHLESGLDVVFVGFNPGDLSSRRGHYYAHPSNQFWTFLHLSGLTPRKLAPEEDQLLPAFGIGITDIVKRWSRSASDLRTEDYRAGVPKLRAKLLSARPRVVAFNGKTVYEKFSGRPAKLGRQSDTLQGIHMFVLPNTSGLNASVSRTEKLKYFCELASFVRALKSEAGAAGSRR